MHPLYGALPMPYVPVGVTRGTLVAHRYTYATPLCRTSQYRITFISLSVSPWNDIADLVLDGVELAGFKSSANDFVLASAALLVIDFYYFAVSLLSRYRLVLWGWGVWTDRV